MSEDRVRLNEYEYHLYEEARSGRMSRRDVLRRAAAMGLAAPVIGVLAACGTTPGNGASSGSSSGPSGRPKKGGHARFGVQVATASPDPVTMFDEGSIQAVQIAGEYLCWPNPDNSLSPRLATSWKADTPSEWTFKLRQGVKFHNGKTMTADDVVATVDLLTNTQNGSSFLSQAKGILDSGQTEKIDDYTVKFHLSQPFVDFPYLMSAYNYNAVILPKGYEIGSFLKKPQGTGPFMVSKYVPNQSITYTRNPHYWLPGLPYLDGATLTYYQSDQGVLTAAQSGELDIMAYAPYGAAQTLGKSGSMRLVPAKSTAFDTLQMRTDMKPFDDVNKRLAVACCLDRPGLIKTVLDGYGTVGNDHPFSPMFKESPLADQQVPQRKQDYKLAKEYLAKAGTPRGFSVTLTTQNYEDIPSYATAVKQQCAPAGIDVNIQQVTQTAFYGSGNNQPWLSVPFGITNWAPRGASAQFILTAFQSAGIWNSAHWKNAQYTSLFKDLSATLDEQKRAQAAAQMAKIQNAECPDIIAYWLTQLRAEAPTVGGFPAGPAEYLDVRQTWLS
ncbi:MAG: ABC transporter substrate-binding protein [Streptosporangiales bacterium]|nr:ABC transporter substrate-binding protein [Streptosporangiales bacterium]